MSHTKRTLVGVFALSIIGCAEHASLPEPEICEWIENVAPPPPTPLLTAALDDGPPALSHHLNVSLTTEDVPGAVARVEELLFELGGEIRSSSANRVHANFGAFLPSEARAEFRPAILQLGDVTNESSSSSDNSVEWRRLRRRSALLNEAEHRVAMAFGSSPGPDGGEALALVRELTQREHVNLNAQWQNYRRRVGFVQINLSFSKPAPPEQR